MAGFENNVLVAKNVNFDDAGPKPHLGIITTDGQLLIGSTITPYLQAGVITSPLGTLSVGYSAPNLTLDVAVEVFTWSDQPTDFAAIAGNGYFVTGGATATLPASPIQGNTISFVVDTASQLTITANTGQKIRIGKVISALAGIAQNNSQGDAITLVYRASDAVWFSLPGPQGTWSIT